MRARRACVPAGKNLDEAEFAAGFNACLATEETARLKRESLRFRLGERVEAKVGLSDWRPGEVVQLLYREEGMPPGVVAPYQVRLADEEGTLLWCQTDVDEVVRRPRRRSKRLRGSGRGADDTADESE